MKQPNLWAFLSLVSFAAPAFAEIPRIESSFDCVPVKKLESPMRVEWDSLLAIQSVRSEYRQWENRREHFTDVKSRMFFSLQQREVDVTDRYNNAEYRDLLIPGEGLHNLRYDAVVFSVTKQDVPFSIGPILPGTYPATATLTLVSTYREKSGDPVKKVATREIELNCKFKIGYGPF